MRINSFEKCLIGMTFNLLRTVKNCRLNNLNGIYCISFRKNIKLNLNLSRNLQNLTLPKRPEKLSKYVINGPVNLKTFAYQIGYPEKKIMSTLQCLGYNKEDLSSVINIDILELVLESLKIPFEVRKLKLEQVHERIPIITIVGHVDHGKTTLLDYLRKSSIAANESGGITQKISAFTVELNNNRKICFIDTPGHSTFQNVRSRGVQATDLVVLIIAGDCGVKEQTIECIKLIKAASVPFVICITKVDKKKLNINMIYDQLLEYQIEVDKLGGKIPSFEVSSITGSGINNFLNGISMYSQKIDLLYDPNAEAIGTIIDSNINRSVGYCTTCILKHGTVKKGDIIHCLSGYGRVRQIIKENGQDIDQVTPSQPFGLVGWKYNPIPGDIFTIINDKTKIKELKKKFEQNKPELIEKIFKPKNSGTNFTLGEKSFLIYDKSSPLQINLFIKGLNYGSCEAIVHGIKNCKDERVSFNIYHCSVDDFNIKTVECLDPHNTFLYCFESNPGKDKHEYLKNIGFNIQRFDIIYRLFDDIRHNTVSMLNGGYGFKEVGKAKVLNIFNFTGKSSRIVLGLRVTDGSIHNDSNFFCKFYRNKDLICTEQIVSMKRHKQDATVVNSGTECGISIKSAQNVQLGDSLICFKVIKDEKCLEWYY